MENKKVKINPDKVTYDGYSVKLIIKDEETFIKKLKEKQNRILDDLKKEVVDEK